MDIFELKNDFFKKKIQVLELTKKGVVLKSDNTLFPIAEGVNLPSVHPFFYAITPLLEQLQEKIQFPCVNLVIDNVARIVDIDVLKKDKNYFVIMVDFTTHYEESQPLVQEKNETSITNYKLHFERELLLAKENFKNDFLAHLNHEIRNPLNSLLGFTEILSKTKLSFQQKETVGVINRTGTHIKVLMDDLLDISKIETGNLTLKNTPFNLNTLIVNITKHFQIKEQNSNVKLRYNIEKKLPVKLIGDPVRLNQILYNLLTNAYRSTSKGEIVIAVSTTKLEKDDVSLNFTVKDTGKGIPNKNINKIFESYSQFEVEKITPVGEGLGLKIVQDLTNLMGGTIKVISEVDEGTQFSITLPFKTRETSNKKKTVPKGSGLMLSKRVLAIENDEVSQMLLMKQFLDADSGYYLEIASTCEQAKKLLDTKKYDAILLKTKLEDCDGLQLTSYIKNNKENNIASTPIIVASGKAMIAEQEATIEAGASAFLKKPYTQKQLFKMLEKTIAISG